MIFGIVILLMLGAIAFFHYVQGFFSGLISAILAIFCAVFALSYYETLVEGPLSGTAPEWMPALMLLGLFALPYAILRTLFDKMIPGQLQLPAVVDKVGGAAMGVVAGIFALGVVVVAAQTMAFGPSLGGYVRYATVDRTVTVPGAGGTGVGARAKDAATENEIDGETFDPEKAKKMLIPVDDVLVGTVAHLSDTGALAADKPFRSVHPDFLTELFGQRLGIQGPAPRTIINNPAKNLVGVELLGAYAMPPIDPSKMVDAELKRIRGTPIKAPSLPPDEIRVVMRVKFDPPAADPKDKRVRVSPSSVRLVAKRPDETSATGEPDWHDYFPIGTLEPNGYLYVNKIDDYLIIDLPGKKVGGGDTAPEVDFVFQVKREGFLPPKTENDPEPHIEAGSFLEIKKLGRIDLSNKPMKMEYKPLEVLAVKRKRLDLEGGPAPMEAGKGKTAAAGTPTPTPAPAGASGGGGALGQRLVGEWKTGTAVTGAETITFAADGSMNSSKGGAMRWVAAGPPQGETITIKTAAGAADPAAGEQHTIVFEDENQFTMTDSAGNRRFSRVGSPAAAASENAEITGPDQAVSRMVGKWSEPDGMEYSFRVDGTYTVKKDAQSGTGKWKVKTVDKGVAEVELTTKSGKVSTQKWKLQGVAPNQMIRTDQEQVMVFTRKS